VTFIVVVAAAVWHLSIKEHDDDDDVLQYCNDNRYANDNKLVSVDGNNNQMNQLLCNNM